MLSEPLPAPIIDGLGVAFCDARGRVSYAREVDAAAAPWRRGNRCLIIETIDAVRRVWHYPADGRERSAEALSELLIAR
jgi:hypothetical protein